MSSAAPAPAEAVAQEIERLRREIEEHNRNYYIHDQPTVSDIIVVTNFAAQ